MRARSLSLPVGLTLFALVAGCAGPKVHLRHQLGSPAHTGISPAALQVGRFQVQPHDSAQLSGYLQDKLRQRLADFTLNHHSASTQPPATVTGTININARDSRGIRHIRRYHPTIGGLQDFEVPTLRRDVIVAVNFILLDPTDGRPITLETRRPYSSHQDPEIRGERGLLRPDDPKHVPPTNTIARRLIDECIADFLGMIHLYEIAAQVALRHAPGPQAAKGSRAVKRADFAAAAEHYRAALQDRPDDPRLHFNLALVSEAGKDLAAAENHYRAALKNQKRPDPQAKAGLDRVMRVQNIIARRQELGGP